MWTLNSRGRGLTALVVVGGPGLVTLLALLEHRVPATTAAMLYMLAVALSSGIGGSVAGMASSILSFLALNFFFTRPLHTFAVDDAQELIALVLFLVVAVTTGLLLSVTLTQKSIAERREAQTRLLNRFTSRQLSGEPLELVLRELGESLVDLFGFARCVITTEITDPLNLLGDTEAATGESHELELASKGRTIGKMRVTLPATRSRLDHDEVAVLQAFASQLALALESVRLSNEMKQVQFDAETNRLRAALFSSVTHDLKTPLSAITASVTSLLDGQGFSREQRYEHLETIKQEAERLNRVVTNLLDLSRLRAGALTPSKAPAPIDELIEAVVARLKPLLDGRDVSIDVREDLLDVPMDIVQVDQVMTNLIENAVKFSPARSPIRITAVGGPACVRVTVADRGPGIPKDERERVFQPFERGTGEAVGTGLGLAIARAVVLAHGGRMWVQDGPVGGAAVSFELPIEAPVEENEESGTARTRR